MWIKIFLPFNILIKVGEGGWTCHRGAKISNDVRLYYSGVRKICPHQAGQFKSY